METPSKLAQARIDRGFTQAKVAEFVEVNVITICRWEKGTSQPYPCHVKKLCDFFEKTAFELGFAPPEPQAVQPSSQPDESQPDEAHPKGDNAFAKFFRRDIELRLQYIMYDWLHSKKLSSSYAILQHRISRELKDDDSMTNEPKQNHQGMDITRRTALRHLALLPIHALGLDALGAAASWAPEDLLTHCAAGITACEHLSKGQHEDMSLAYAVLTTYLTPLKTIVDESSLHRKEAARLVAQALKCKATLSLHREGPKRAVSYGKQAAVYAKVSEDILLQIMALVKLAWIYSCDKQEKQALVTALQAKSLLLKQQKKGLPIHPTIPRSVYAVTAKYHARNGQGEDALTAMQDAHGDFSAQSENDMTTFHAEFNDSTLILNDGLTNYYLEQYNQALSTLEQAIDFETLAPKMPASSARVRIEIINHATLASLKSPTKDMERSIYLWKAGIQGAIDLRSEQRFNEALTAYDIMQALWSGDRRIKELHDLMQHW
jgi:DNA-binding XRE family transcriptional regulator